MIGLNVTEAIILRSADRQRVFSAIKAMGVNEIRVEFPWLEFVKSWALCDDVMADADTAGLNVLVMVAHPPSPLPSAIVFGNEMNVLADRYPQVKAIEVWNEPNAQEFWDKGRPETFIPYLKAAYEGIKSRNANTRVVLGGLAACPSGSRQWWQFWLPPYTNVDPIQFLTRLLDAGGGPYFDVLALHNYSWDAGFRWKPFSPALPYIGNIDAAQTLMGAREIWTTEYGFPINKFTEVQQSTNLAAETNYLEGRVARQYILSYRDFKGGPYGLVNANNVDRLAANWLRSYQQ